MGMGLAWHSDVFSGPFFLLLLLLFLESERAWAFFIYSQCLRCSGNDGMDYVRIEAFFFSLLLLLVGHFVNIITSTSKLKSTLYQSINLEL
jgi:hypothetical protein